MAKEKFLIVAVQTPDDCFGRFSETENCAAIDAGKADPDDAYSWIEASFELVLVRHREATHICSFTPSARYTWLQNYFVGIPNAAWDRAGDPDGLERENGDEVGGYGTYRDDYDPRFIVESFTVDSMKDLDRPMRKPHVSDSLSRRTDAEVDRLEAYTNAIWECAEEAAWEMMSNGFAETPILNVWTYRQWVREEHLKARDRAAERSRWEARMQAEEAGR